MAYNLGTDNANELFMAEHQFEYGPVSKGLFFGLECLTILVALFATEYLGYYLLLLLFFGIGLRLILEKTGLYHWLSYNSQKLDERLHRTQLEEKRAEVDRKARDFKYRQSRSRGKDPKLPKNW